MPPGRARPRRLLLLLIPLTLLVQGALYSRLYPRLALLAWLAPAALGMANAGAILYCLPRWRAPIAQWAAGALAVGASVAVAIVATAGRNLLLLERHGHAPGWAQLVRPSEWWGLQRAVVGLDICCSRGGGVFPPLSHWSFVALELSASAAGAAWVVLTLQRQRGREGSLPD